MATATVKLEATPELNEALEKAEHTVERAERLTHPFDYDTMQPLAMLSAKLVSEYYYALVNGKVAPTLIDNLVYDFHRILWGQALDS